MIARARSAKLMHGAVRPGQSGLARAAQFITFNTRLSSSREQLVPVNRRHSTRENDNDTRCSQAVTHPRTNRPRCCLTFVIRRKLVFSPWYGRCWRNKAVLLTTIYAGKGEGRVVRVGGGVETSPPFPSVFFTPGRQTDTGT